MVTAIRTKERTDEAIYKDIIDQLYWDGRVDASDVKVTVDKGMVTLSGNVPTYRARNAAADDTWVVGGVKSVSNRLAVRYPVVPILPTNVEIQTSVQNALIYDPDIFSHKIDVTVANGWVTLKGVVDAYWKKQQTEEDAFSVRGVVGVTNELAVVPTNRTSDEEIANRVVNALERNVSVDVDDITVTVNNGNVMLRGTVSSSYAKRAAYHSAFYTSGVISVIDDIKVNW